MLATGYAWSNSGKTLTLTIRSGVKWNDGKPFSASDVAYTFDLHQGATRSSYTAGAPIVTSATAAKRRPARCSTSPSRSTPTCS